MCGTAGKKCNPFTLTSNVLRQRLLLLINSRPLGINDITRKLGISTDEVIKHLNELIRCGLVIEVNGLYKPSFAIFSLKDQKTLQPLIDKLSDDIVRVVKNYEGELRKVIDDLSIVRRGLKFADLKYVIIGAITLDYEGLEILSKEGILVKSRKMPGGECIFAGFEVGLMDLRQVWMWGHNEVFGGYWFSSHGKLPPRGMRIALPDLTWLWHEDSRGIDKVKPKMIEIGNILEALLYNDLTIGDLSKELNMEEVDLIAELALLLALGYVILYKGRTLRINIPVFTLKDYENVKSLSGCVLRSIVGSLKDKEDTIVEYYGKTSPARNGVHVKEAFNQIYHLIFGRTLTKLIRNGIIKSPPLRPDGGEYSVFMVILNGV